MNTPIDKLLAIVLEGLLLGWISGEEAAAAILSLYRWRDDSSGEASGH